MGKSATEKNWLMASDFICKCETSSSLSKAKMISTEKIAFALSLRPRSGSPSCMNLFITKELLDERQS